MRNLMFGAFSLALSANALAGDLPRRGSPLPPSPTLAYGALPQAFSWSGFYIGLNAGGLRGNGDMQAYGTGGFVGQTFEDSYDRSIRNRLWSMTGGVQLGYNYQFGDGLVLGLEGDVNAHSGRRVSKVEQVINPPLNPVGRVTQDPGRLYATLRARLGIAFDTGLIYVTGGLASGEIRASSEYADDTSESWKGASSKIAGGWAAGAGLEFAIADKWSLKSEYLYVDLGRDKFGLTGAVLYIDPGYTIEARHRDRFHIARLGLNYRFASTASAPLLR